MSLCARFVCNIRTHRSEHPGGASRYCNLPSQRLALFGRFPHGHLRSKLKPFFRASCSSVFCAAQNNARTAVVMITNQVLHSLRFLPIKARLLLLFPLLIQ